MKSSMIPCSHPQRLPEHQAASPTCTIRMTVDAGSITALRRLAMHVCGEALEFMRIALCAGGGRMRVWLCVRLPVAALLRDTVASQMPGARLGRAIGMRGAGA